MRILDYLHLLLFKQHILSPGKQVSAMNMFKMMDKKGAVSNDGDSVNTKHKNAILQVNVYLYYFDYVC